MRDRIGSCCPPRVKVINAVCKLLYMLFYRFFRRSIMYTHTHIPAILRETKKIYIAHICIWVCMCAGPTPGRKKTKIGHFLFGTIIHNCWSFFMAQKNNNNRYAWIFELPLVFFSTSYWIENLPLEIMRSKVQNFW